MSAVIDIGSLELQAAGFTVTGSPWFDVTHPSFSGGVKSDGSTLDTNAWTAAFAAIVAAGGGVAYFKRGLSYSRVTTIAVPAGVTLLAQRGAEIRSLSTTTLQIVGSCTLRGLAATAPTTVSGAKGIDNTGFDVDAADCVFTGNTNRAGDTGTSRYVSCDFHSASALGTTAWSATNDFSICRFLGQNGVDAQGGVFTWCRMVGDGDGVTSGEGWGVHMPLTTGADASFEYCYIRGNGLNAYGMGLGNQGRPKMRYCDIEGTKWGLYYRTDSSFTAEFCRIVGGDYGIEFNKVLASPTTVPTTTVTDSYARGCYIDATNPGTNYDIAAPTTSAYGLLVLEGCDYGRIVADDALGGSTESSCVVISPQVGWVRNQGKVNAPAAPATGDEYVATNVASFPHRRMWWGAGWTQFLMAHADTTANRPNGANQFAGYLYYDLSTNTHVVRDTDGNWRPLGHSKPVAFTAGDTTPSVLDATRCKTANASATSITTFDDGIDGQSITVLVDANTTLVHGSTLKLSGGVNFVGTANDLITLTRFAGVWYEQSRSVNG